MSNTLATPFVDGPMPNMATHEQQINNTLQHVSNTLATPFVDPCQTWPLCLPYEPSGSFSSDVHGTLVGLPPGKIATH